MLPCLFWGPLWTTKVSKQENGPQSVKMNVEICQFSLPDSLKESFASFTVVYSFLIKKNGTPLNIKRVRGTAISELKDEQVIECLSKWKFEGMAQGARILVDFRWEHGIGWTEAGIAWKGFSQRLKLSGRCCQYSTK